MAFIFEKTKLQGVVIIQPQVFGDRRGYFMETFKKTTLFVQVLIGNLYRITRAQVLKAY